MSQPSTICPICGLQVANADKLCHKCQLLSTTPLNALWFVGNRDHLLKQLISEYKYQSVRALGPILADLLHHSIPQDLPALTIVPLPTIGKHIRARGFDHTLQIAKHLAKIRGWQVQPLLARAKDTVQVGTKAQQREAQANAAYVLTRPLGPSVSAQPLGPNSTYLLLDDVWTTGASMLAAAKILRQAAPDATIYAAVIGVSI